jgi:hypothetical protein
MHGLWHNGSDLRPPLLTFEPVLTEAAFPLKRENRDAPMLGRPD